MTEPILNKNDLVRYMMFVHENEYGSEISRIKLQKGLYFLFAYWVHNVKTQLSQRSEVEDLMKSISNVLFKTDFKAWAYGPVDQEVYNLHRNGSLIPYTEQEAAEFIGNTNQLAAQHVQSMTRRIFNSSDFGLVDLSHRDNAWSDHYDSTDSFHNELIPEHEIISLYENR